MARPLRLEYEGALYHVTSRGNGRQAIFLDDADNLKFLELLGKTVDRFRWVCHAFCLMVNHYHLMIETPDANLSKGMHHLNTTFCLAHNKRHQRVGHLFQGRFKSIVVDREHYLLELARYVVLNPVRAGMVTTPADWPWSSYRQTAGLPQADAVAAVTSFVAAALLLE
ncbi:MAG: transposase, partial [Syntrophales bacterium]|nr:transposase [Syntrophales bacterium]